MTFEQPRSRREFLRLGCRAMSTIGAAAAFGKAGLFTARAQTASDYKALVCIFLFGGNDANNLLVPNGTRILRRLPEDPAEPGSFARLAA